MEDMFYKKVNVNEFQGRGHMISDQGRWEVTKAFLGH